MSITLIVVMVLWVYMYVDAHQIVFFKYGQFNVCQLSFNKAVEREGGREEKRTEGREGEKRELWATLSLMCLSFALDQLI